MKKIYKLSKKEIKEKEKEFRKTPWGNEYWSELLILDGVFIIFLIVSFMSSLYNLTESNSWILFFIFLSLNIILKYMYNNKLEEYIESEKETKEKSK